MFIIGLLYAGLLTDLPISVRDVETRRTIRGATVRCGAAGAITDYRGIALLRECTDTVVVKTTMAGYVPRTDTIIIGSVGDTLTLYLATRSFDGAQITVTGTRTAQPRDESPALVSLTDRDALRAVQALSMAEGLSFQPGLRLENNCQNCGFTQVRLNGMQGPYTQILIDSRPVFSSLAGVYGLEHIPIEMIDRIEVVRGAGSSLYGAGAVAGTVNVIPRDPTTTSISASSTGSWLNGQIPDAMTSLRGTWASADLSTGVSVFGVTRGRSAYDHNGDAFSEVPLTRTTSGGVRAVHEFSERDRLTLDAHWIREFRRGGNLFDRPPFEAEIAEQIDHAIAGGAVSYEHAFDDRASRLHLYVSARSTRRASYYGGTGGDPAMTSDAARFFGTTDDEIGVAGVQATTRSWSIGTVPLLVIGGVEIQHADVDDAMPGYERRIEQRINDVGSYAQVQIAPGSSISVALGLRADALRIDGRYRFDSRSNETVSTSFFVLNPRIAIIGRINDDWQLRTTYASGFRGPQAFDEDLHISTLQGAARLIRLDPGLRPERSHCITLSMDGTMATPTTALGITADLFATVLTSPFVTALTSDSLPGSNTSIARKTNGDASYVAGTNLEVRYALARTFELTTSLTLQYARYATAQVVAESNQGAVITTPNILRTPDVYASAIATWMPTSALTFDASCILTGPMWVVNERLIERFRTPWFADLGIQATYATQLGNVGVTLGLGIVNILNAYQRDLERGSQRDAAYFYGPLRPRTISCSMGVTWE